MLFTCCFLHTILQERRKFGSLGMNIPYEFNHSDLTASVQFLAKYFHSIGSKKAAAGDIVWSAVRYMVCEVMYGGRVTDEFDRRLLNSYGDVWLDSKIFSTEFSFHEPYTIPTLSHPTQSLSSQLGNVLEFISALPSYDSPELFGLHANANRAYQMKQTSMILSSISGATPQGNSRAGSAEGGDERARQVIVQMLDSLPHEPPAAAVRRAVAKIGPADPYAIVLRQELARMQLVLNTVGRDLSDLKLAIAGTIVMSERLQRVMSSLSDAKVPLGWEQVSWVSTSLGVWSESIQRRSKQLHDWVASVRMAMAWLPGFFNPQAFLTAIRQEISRSNHWPFDQVVLSTEVTKLSAEKVDGPASEGMLIHGLILEGGAWSTKNGTLVDSAPKVLFSPLPVVHVSASVVEATKESLQAAARAAERTYCCPVYLNPQRKGTDLVAEFYLPCPPPSNKWVLRGVALLCTSS